MKRYIPSEIEPKWQQTWADTKLYAASDSSEREKYYYLVEFPYPSGDGLHVGHVRSYTALDIMARHKRMQGFNVLYPMGFDAFGLPTENFAIKNKIAPQIATERNVATFTRQLKSLGLSFDWDRVVNTTDPDYYKWTQWIFLRLLEAGLAYQDEIAINWCPFEKTGLANEEVVDGKHERCGTPVEKKLLKQWILKITAYADRLIDDLGTVDYLDRVSAQQINWIGRSEGAEIEFVIPAEAGTKPVHNGKILNQVQDDKGSVTVYTTRPDTLAGATFLVLAPEHPLVESITTEEQRSKVNQYIKKTQSESEVARQETDRPKTGVWTGATTTNPITGDDMPVWIADYVLAGYGTGAIMAVPAHDQRDYDFAKAFNLPIKSVIEPLVIQTTGTATFRPDEPAQDSRGIIAIVKHWQDDKYLGLRWQAASWGTLLTGGIDEGFTPEETVLKEIYEETGFKHAKITADLGIIHGRYYHAPKKLNRFGHAPTFIVELADGDRDEVSIEEQNKHDMLWLTKDEMKSFLTSASHLMAMELMAQPVYTGTGILTNSGQFDGLESDAAKSAIVAWLEAKGVGKKATKYKLRDWVFSRQHYWGEPIPVIHCPQCAVSDAKTSLSLSFYYQPTWDAILNGVKTVESRALNPHESKRFFGDVAVGDIVELVNKTSDERLAIEILESRRFKNVAELNADEGWATEVSETGTKKSLKQQAADFASYSPDYMDRIDQNGLIAWRFKLVTKVVPVPEDQLPVALPHVESYEPTETGESPLAAMTDWVNVDCPKCGGPAKRETDTMPNWAGSSWYYLRYMDPHNDQAFAGQEALDYWSPVDLYNGGMEHTTLHLLYSRFWHKFLFDQGLVPTSEPYAARRSHGMILGPDGVKMSKSKGNVINPDAVIERYGADALRLYEMFMGPFDEMTAWSDERLSGVSRFVYRVWTLAQELIDAHNTPDGSTGPDQENTGTFDTEVDRMTHKTLKKVHHDIESMNFNTMVSSLMEYINFLTDARIKTALLEPAHAELASRTLRTLILMLAPAVPHLAEELWNQIGNEGSVHVAAWPKYDPELIKEDLVQVIVQVNGKLRGTITMPIDVTEDEMKEAAAAEPNAVKYLEGVDIVKIIVVPRKLVNFVVK